MLRPKISRRGRPGPYRLARVRTAGTGWVAVAVSLAAYLSAATPAGAAPPEDGANQIFAVSSSQVTVIDAKTKSRKVAAKRAVNHLRRS